eukprot:m.179224 g.179224  ORF g.179224 m.179224 type:complete len:396 (+) comp14714_c0_seq1:247-1434(+)
MHEGDSRGHAQQRSSTRVNQRVRRCRGAVSSHVASVCAAAALLITAPSTHTILWAAASDTNLNAASHHTFHQPNPHWDGLKHRHGWERPRARRFQHNYELVPREARYDAHHKVLMCVSPKAGSSSFYRWLYRISTEGKIYDECDLFVKQKHEHRHPHWLGPCWESGADRQHRLHLVNPRSLPREEQKKILSDPDVFRFSITRDPVARAISAWKSKLACDGWYYTDLTDRGPFLSMLLELSTFPKDKLKDETCMSLIEYAHVLAAIPETLFQELPYIPGGPHFASQNDDCLLSNVNYTHVQPLETMSGDLPAILELVKRLGTDLDTHPLLHVHASSLNDTDTATDTTIGTTTELPATVATVTTQGPIPGATAEEVVQARAILSKVFARDLEIMAQS